MLDTCEGTQFAPDASHVFRLQHLRRRPRLHGREQTDAGTAHRARQLHRREDRDVGLLVDDLLFLGEIEIVVGWRPAADPAGVEDLVRAPPFVPPRSARNAGLKRSRPSRKNGRFSGKKVSKVERFSTSWRPPPARSRDWGPHQRQIARQVVAEVEPGADGALPLGIERGRGATPELRARFA